MSASKGYGVDNSTQACDLDCWLQSLPDIQSEKLILPKNSEILRCLECNFFNQVITRAKGRRFADQKADSFMKLLSDQVRSYTSELEKKSYDLKKRIEVLTILNRVSDALLKSNDLSKSLRVVLTGVTAGEAFGFNRAFIFLVNEKKKTLEGKIALGPETKEEASRIWSELKEKRITFDQMIQEVLDGGSEAPNALTQRIEKISVPLRSDSSLLAQAVFTRKSFNLKDSDGQDALNLLRDLNLTDILDSSTFVVVPILSENKAIGILVADNLITHQTISDEDVSALQTLVNQAASQIENIILQRELSLKLRELEHINKLLRDNQEYLLKHERLADIGKLATTAAHEIKTPLISIGGYAHRALKYTSQANRKNLEVIIKEVERLETITSQILDYSRESKLVLKEHNINQLIREALEILKDKFRYNNIQLKTKLYPDMGEIKVDAQRLKQVLFNFIENAVEAMLGGGILKITTKKKNTYVVLEVEDTGCGIPEEIKKDLFVPFFSTKPNGSGLGLAVSKKIITDHNGDIRVESKAGKGTKFSVYLPINN